MRAVKARKPKSKPTSRDHRDHLDRLLDKALADTFPASDPVAIDFDEPPNDSVSEKRTK